MMKIYVESAIGDQWEQSYDLDEVDGTLVRYTLNPTTPISSIFDDALYEYSNDTAITVYRGLNFSKKEYYDEFMNSIDNGKLKIEKCSSWSPSKSTAEIFAITRPCYMEFMAFGAMTLISQQEKESERITGYRGVILKTRIKPNTGIDLRKTTFAKEDEIILKPGTYRVEVTDVLSYKDSLENTTVDDMIYSLRNKSDELKKFIAYVKKHYTPDDISEESKNILFKSVVKSKSVGTYEVHYIPSNKYCDYDKIEAYFYGAMPSEWYPENKNNLLINKGKKSFKSFIDKVFKDYADNDYKAKINWGCDVNKLANIYNMEYYLSKYTKQLGQQYQDYNREAVKAINQIKDPTERQQAVKDYQFNVKRLLTNMGFK